MKLADLKRIAVGTRLRLVHCLMGPVSEVNQLRIVRAVHSNSIEMERDGKAESSWLYFGKAKDFRDDGDGFAFMEGERVCAQYKFEDKYCEACKVLHHDVCSDTPGCPCCEAGAGE